MSCLSRWEFLNKCRRYDARSSPTFESSLFDYKTKQAQTRVARVIVLNFLVIARFEAT
jgi:hypothetical protein